MIVFAIVFSLFPSVAKALTISDVTAALEDSSTSASAQDLTYTDLTVTFGAVSDLDKNTLVLIGLPSSFIHNTFLSTYVAFSYETGGNHSSTCSALAPGDWTTATGASSFHDASFSYDGGTVSGVDTATFGTSGGEENKINLYYTSDSGSGMSNQKFIGISAPRSMSGTVFQTGQCLKMSIFPMLLGNPLAAGDYDVNVNLVPFDSGTGAVGMGGDSGLDTVTIVASDTSVASNAILNYQGRLMDTSDNLLGGSSGTNYCFRFSFYDANVNGTKVWPATAPSTMTVNVKSGVFNVPIGDTDLGGDSLSNFDFSLYTRVYLQVQVAAQVSSSCAGVTFDTLSPMQKVGTAAYAVNSKRVSGFTAAQSASANEIPVLTNGNLILGGANPQINAATTNKIKLQSNMNASTEGVTFFAGTTSQIDFYGEGSSSNAFITTSSGSLNFQSNSTQDVTFFGGSLYPITFDGATGNADFSGNVTAGNFDLAENYPISDMSIGAGDILSLTQQTKVVCKRSGEDCDNVAVSGRSQSPYDTMTFGVVSTKPGLTLAPSYDYTRPIALAGRVPVKISNENGAIAIGDPITTSSAPGVGMKATHSGYVVGTALEPYNGQGQGKITIFVHPRYWFAGGGEEALVPEPAAEEGTSTTTTTTTTTPVATETTPSFMVQYAGFSMDSLLQREFALVAQIGQQVAQFTTIVADTIKAKIIVVEHLYASIFTVVPDGEIRLPIGDNQIAGTGKILAGTSSVVIQNTRVMPDAKIMITSLTLIDVPLVVTKKEQGISFTVSMIKNASQDVEFDWIIFSGYATKDELLKRQQGSSIPVESDTPSSAEPTPEVAPEPALEPVPEPTSAPESIPDTPSSVPDASLPPDPVLDVEPIADPEPLPETLSEPAPAPAPDL